MLWYNKNTKRKEKTKKMRKVKVLCPEDNFDCPYCKNGECAIESPQIECDVFDGFDVFDYILPEERTALE